MTDQRPRPRYGEYATPEEQARALGVPAHGVQHPSPATRPAVPVEPQEGVDGQLVGRRGAGRLGAERQGAERRGREGAARFNRPRDIVTTVVLLACGLVWVLLSVPGASDFAGTLDRTYAMQGYTGHYGPVALASAIGLAINISSIALWGITAAVSIAVIRKHRRAFYIPIIGAVVAGIVVLALTLVAMLSDPGLIAYVNSLQK